MLAPAPGGDTDTAAGPAVARLGSGPPALGEDRVLLSAAEPRSRWRRTKFCAVGQERRNAWEQAGHAGGSGEALPAGGEHSTAQHPCGGGFCRWGDKEQLPGARCGGFANSQRLLIPGVG